MNASKQKAKFEEHLREIVDAFGKECRQNKRVALRLRISSVLLSAVITVCLGIRLGEQAAVWQAGLSNIALTLSAVITVVGAYEAFFDPRAIWIRETIIFTRLRSEARI